MERPRWSSRRRGPARAARQSRRPAHEAAAPSRARSPGPSQPPRLDVTAACLDRHPLPVASPAQVPAGRPYSLVFFGAEDGGQVFRHFRADDSGTAADAADYADVPPETSPDATTLSPPVVATLSNWERCCQRGGGTKSMRRLRPYPGACALLGARAGPAHCLRLRLWTAAPRVLSTAVSRSRRWDRALSPCWPSCPRPPTSAAVDKGLCPASWRALNHSILTVTRLTFKSPNFQAEPNLRYLRQRPRLRGHLGWMTLSALSGYRATSIRGRTVEEGCGKLGSPHRLSLVNLVTGTRMNDPIRSTRPLVCSSFFLPTRPFTPH